MYVAFMPHWVSNLCAEAQDEHTPYSEEDSFKEGTAASAKITIHLGIAYGQVCFQDRRSIAKL